MVVTVTAVDMHMAMVMPMRPADAIGPTFGNERFRDLGHLRAQTTQHVGHDRVLADQEASVFDLAGGVTVADMPGEPDQIAATDLDQVFLGSDHFDQGTVFQNEAIPVLQRDCFRQIHEDRLVMHGVQNFAPQKPRLVVEGYKVGRDGDTALFGA